MGLAAHAGMKGESRELSVAIENSVPSGARHRLAIHARGTRAPSMRATSRGSGGGAGSKAADQVLNGALPAGAVSRAGFS